MDYILDLYKSRLNARTSDFYSGYAADCLVKDVAAPTMLDFDTDVVYDELRTVLGEKARIRRNYDKEQKKGWLTVRATYETARDVISLALPVVLRHALTLFDRQNENVHWSAPYILNEAKITATLRAEKVELELARTQQPIWSLFKIEERHDWRGTEYVGFVLTLRYDANRTLLERAENVYRCLHGLLIDGENLVCKNRCFAVEGEEYRISVCVEAYRGFANRACYYEDENPQWSLLRRMSCHAANSVLAGMSAVQKADVLASLRFSEMVEGAPNFADRFVACLKYSRLLRKQKLGIRYSDVGTYGAEFVFHRTDLDDYPDLIYHASCMKVEESAASFILSVIGEFYPYIGPRYYLDDNLLPAEMWKDILKKLERIAWLILHDTHSPELRPYIERFDLYAVDTYRRFDSDDDPVQFVFKNRKAIFEFYKIFIEWVEKQFEISSNPTINFSGP